MKPFTTLLAAALLATGSLRASEWLRGETVRNEVNREHERELRELSDKLKADLAAPPLAQHYIAPPPPQAHSSSGTESAERSIFGTPGSLEAAIGNYTVRNRSEGRFSSTRELVEAHERTRPRVPFSASRRNPVRRDAEQHTRDAYAPSPS